MGEPLRILQLIGSSGPGSAEKFYLRLVRSLHKRDDVDVLPVVRTGSWLDARLTEENIPHQTLPFGSFFDFKTRPQLAEIVKKFKPHVVQSWMNRASKYLPRNGVPTVARLGGYYKLKNYRGVDRLVGNTEDICRYIRDQKWPADHVHYIPNFVDMPRPDYKAHRHDVRAEYSIPQEAKVVLMVGRLHEVKGFDTALFALTRLPDNVHCILAGEGPEHAALKAAVEADGIAHRVHFTGWVNHISPLFAAADAFLVPSRHEPLGNVVLEGWAHAVPVVATESAGPKALIQNGETGLLVPIDDDKAMAAALSRVLADKDLAAHLAQQGHQHIQQHFTEEQIVDQYLTLYRQMVKA